MAFFGFERKKKEQVTPCSCGGTCGAEEMNIEKHLENQDMDIKVLGSGCAKCNELEEAVKAALHQMGLDTTVDHVTDFAKISAYGVMTTPALVVNGKVVSYGKVLKKEEVLSLLKNFFG